MCLRYMGISASSRQGQDPAAVGLGDAAPAWMSWHSTHVESARSAWSIGSAPTSGDWWQDRQVSEAGSGCGFVGGGDGFGLWHSQHSSWLRPTMLDGRCATLPWQSRQGLSSSACACVMAGPSWATLWQLRHSSSAMPL